MNPHLVLPHLLLRNMRRLILMLRTLCWMLIIGEGTSLQNFAYYSPDGELICSTKNYNMESKASRRLGCGSLCLQNQCEGYFFKDGVCNLAGSITNITNGKRSTTYKRVLYEFNGQNIAFGKTTKSSLHYSWANKDFAVDGNDDTTSYYHSAIGDAHPWWYVDIGQNRAVKEVHVKPFGYFGAGDDHSRHFTTIEIRIGKTPPAVDGDFSSWELISYYEGPPNVSVPYLVFTVNRTFPYFCGQYISLQKVGSLPFDFFVFNEVKVFAFSVSTEF